MNWLVYAFIVIFGAAGMHVFSKLAKGVIHPIAATMIASGVFFCVALVFFLFSSEAKAQVSSLGFGAVWPAVLMGLSMSALNIALFYVYHAGAPLSVAVPFIRVSAAVLGVIIGLLFFAEKLSLMHSVGVGLALLGVVVMAL